MTIYHGTAHIADNLPSSPSRKIQRRNVGFLTVNNPPTGSRWGWGLEKCRISSGPGKIEENVVRGQAEVLKMGCSSWSVMHHLPGSVTRPLLCKSYSGAGGEAPGRTHGLLVEFVLKQTSVIADWLRKLVVDVEELSPQWVSQWEAEVWRSSLSWEKHSGRIPLSIVCTQRD